MRSFLNYSRNYPRNRKPNKIALLIYVIPSSNELSSHLKASAYVRYLFASRYVNHVIRATRKHGIGNRNEDERDVSLKSNARTPPRAWSMIWSRYSSQILPRLYDTRCTNFHQAFACVR